jgi:NAD(P)H-dependent FMN reductase
MTGAARRIVILCASPRLDGNSRVLADALAGGAVDAGHGAEVLELGPTMNGMLRDCRSCRRADGSCSIEDRYEELLFDHVLPADAVVYATPLYWYGMSASLKNFFDRLVCYISASYPRQEKVVAGLKGKRVALLLASEECFPGAALSLVGQLQEIARYFGQEFVGVVNGVGNTRGEVRFDPAGPVDAARRLGAQIFDLHYSDYDVDAVRPNAVWPQARGSAEDAAVTPYSDV